MTVTTFLLSYTLTGLPWQSFVLTGSQRLAMAQAASQQAATVLQQGLTLSSTAYSETWAYSAGGVPVGTWVPAYNSVFSTIGASTSLTSGESAIGQSLAAQLQAAGNAYDAGATPGVKNSGVYALTRNAWCGLVMAPAWYELDRLCRYAFQTYSPSDALSTAAFAGQGTTWAASLALVADSFFVPNPANGYCYECLSSTGTTGGTQPTWSTTLGTDFGDVAGNTWQCLAAVQAAGTALPFDPTLAADTTLVARKTATLLFASGSAPIVTMVGSAYATFLAAFGSQPAANPTADALTVTLTANLNSALAAVRQWVAAATFT